MYIEHQVSECGPRACGVVPTTPAARTRSSRWSPRVRGCSPRTHGGPPWVTVVPARAGLFLLAGILLGLSQGGPRACGVVPSAGVLIGGPCMWSPRVRGCSHAPSAYVPGLRVVPARAGLFLRGARTASTRPGGPRACGVVPSACVRRPCFCQWSPRVRGCSRPLGLDALFVEVVPARAGLFPGRTRTARSPGSGPRACGVVPIIGWTTAAWDWWSPRVRGCSLDAQQGGHRREVVPARAGLFPGPCGPLVS